MVSQQTIDRIIEIARIEEVVGDFLNLKKRGISLIGLCPFHDEKTPSFNVSVAKGIFKCFGCGKGGDVVRFVMDHENSSYPEALRYLAGKYQIEFEEIGNTSDEHELHEQNESLFIVLAWANQFFQRQLLETADGKNIGLTYFQERGFRAEIIKKFGLGYLPDAWDALSQQAILEGYRGDFLENVGLAIRKENGQLYDRFRARVIFPIHNFTGRVIAFGGRTLKTDKTTPKYVNSPESAIYHKSKVLYGLFFAKKAIREADNCYLVEGYVDVLAVHQAGIEQVVASLGTSLTTEQIRLIARFTKNIIILYDGDRAGVQASLRSLDLILEEGLNVKIVLLPDAHDPDSYLRQVGSAAFKSYIQHQQKDFILYKTSILLQDAGTDPIKRAEVIHEIVASIAKIPDSIKASIFVRACSALLQLEERILISELNKMRLNTRKQDDSRVKSLPDSSSDDLLIQAEKLANFSNTDAYQEKEIIRLLLHYGHELVYWDDIVDTPIAVYMIANLADVEFEHIESNIIFEAYRNNLEAGILPSEQDFIKHPQAAVADLAIELLSSPYTLSDNWYAKRKIYIPDEKQNLRMAVLGGIFHLKKRKIDHILQRIAGEIQRETDSDHQMILMKQYMCAKEVEKGISQFLGTVINK